MATNPPWPPTLDAEAARFGNLLALKYGGNLIDGQARLDAVDALGWVRWSSDWRMHRANGMSEAQAWQVVSDAIDAIRAGEPVPVTPPGEYDVPWPPQLDQDAVVFADALTALYRDEHPSGPAAVDALGWVRWSSDYRIARANGFSHDGAYTKIEYDILTIWGKPPEAPPADPPRHLRVEGNQRWFANDRGRFGYREVSDFSLLSLWLAGNAAEAKGVIAERIALRFNMFRLIVTLDGPYWVDEAARLTGRSLRAAPDMPGYMDALLELVRYIGSRGAYARVCLIGATEPFGGVWYPDRRDVWVGTPVQAKGEAFCREAVAHLKGEPNVVIELANEPAQIGLRNSASAQVALGRELVAMAPALLFNGGAVDGADDANMVYAERPFHFVDAHLERSMGVHGFEGVKRMGEHPLIDQRPDQGYTGDPMPFVSGEYVNFGDWRLDGRNDDVVPYAAVAFAYAACSRARRFNAGFHFDKGLWALPMGDASLQCARAYHAALDVFPMLTDAMWRGHWSPSQGNYWKRDIWPPDDNVDTVMTHVASGRGPWRAFGCGAYSMTIAEPVSWDFTRNTTKAGVERLAIWQGPFNAAVYVHQ